MYVQNLLQQMQTRFQDMSNSIVGRIDEMGNRIDSLEKNISDLMQQVRLCKSATDVTPNAVSLLHTRPVSMMSNPRPALLLRLPKRKPASPSVISSIRFC